MRKILSALILAGSILAATSGTALAVDGTFGEALLINVDGSCGDGVLILHVQPPPGGVTVQCSE